MSPGKNVPPLWGCLCSTVTLLACRVVPSTVSEPRHPRASFVPETWVGRVSGTLRRPPPSVPLQTLLVTTFSSRPGAVFSVLTPLPLLLFV